MKPSATKFIFRGYEIDADRRTVFFRYAIAFSDRNPLEFTETIVFPEKMSEEIFAVSKKFLDPILLILGISYYKLYLPSQMEVSFPLSGDQAEFWNTVYRKGLGEFLYRNNIDPERLAKFPVSECVTTSVRVDVSDRILLGIGGGKDSIVAAELLRDFDTTSLLIETQKEDLISGCVAQAIGNPKAIMQRTLDPKLFEAHKGSYNGHIPVSAVFAFLGFFSAAIGGCKYAVVANEQSSNVGNVEYRGEMVNHQWSKSAEFEEMFQKYARKYITPDIVYFSLIRQFYEIRVARMFSEQKKYFSLFSSCNGSFRVAKDRPETLWCGHCAKCVFVFLLLSAFLEKEELVGIFGKNLFVDAELLPLFRDVLGFGEMKPFDCVGTFEESRAALFLAAKKFRGDAVVEEFLPRIDDGDALVSRVLQTVPAPTLPTPFRFLGVERVCILGYGREGKVTERYLRERYPKLEIGILDQAMDENYLDRQRDFDLAVKTPGIAKTKVILPYVTATNLFFAENKNFTIGVTGSKGKSTTASLIFSMLKAAGRKVRLLGNIGVPMLEALLTPVDSDEIFVIELSSYMLDDIEYSPNIAVLLNLFPEHMDYHGGTEPYYEAKKNIFKFQKEGDIALQFPFSDERIPVEEGEIPLLGEHNKKNIQAAVRAVRHLGVSDDAIRAAIKNFQPLPHRLEYLGVFGGISWYDDAISTTPESTIEAIRTLREVDTIFLGGEDRGYDFSELEKVLREYRVKNIVLFPESGRRILGSTEGLRVFETRSMEDAVRFAFQHTQKGKIALLSTASPSYSVWKDFEEKGEMFQKAVFAQSSLTKSV